MMSRTIESSASESSDSLMCSNLTAWSPMRSHLTRGVLQRARKTVTKLTYVRVVAAATVMALASCGGESGGDATHKINGSIKLTADDFEFSDQDAPFWTVCGGTGGYSDIAPGRQVAITDESGDIVATAPLENLTADDTPPLSVVSCTLTFDVEVPDAEFYTVNVGKRPGFTVSKDDLSDQFWRVSLEVGGD